MQHLPFEIGLSGIEGVTHAIINEQYIPIPNNQYSIQLTDLIDRLLDKDPGKRISIKELIDVPIILSAIDSLLKEFEGEVLVELRNFLVSFNQYS